MTPENAPDRASIVVVGDVMVDTTAALTAPLRPDTDNPASLRRSLGGQAANVAAWIAASGHRAHLLGAVGGDAAGEFIRGHLAASGVEHTLYDVPAATGECIIVVDPDGSRTMLPDSGANALIARSGADRGVATLVDAGYTHLHVSGYLPLHDADFAADLVRNARSRGASTSMDAPAVHDASTWSAAEVRALPPVDVLLGTAQEVAWLLGLPWEEDPDALADGVLRLPDRPGCVVVKLGSRGAMALDTRVHAIPAVEADVVDTTGAGDAFTAGFLAAWANGTAVPLATEHAVRDAAVAVSLLGGQPPRGEGQHGD